MLCIAEPTVLEMTKKEKGRKHGFKKLKHFKPLIPPGMICAREIEYYRRQKTQNHRLNIKCKSTWLNNFLRGLKNENSLEYKKIIKRRDEQEIAQDQFWNKIKISINEGVHIQKTDVTNYIENNDFEICENPHVKLSDIIAEIESFENLSNTHPSCANLVKCLALIELLEKPQNATKKFTVYLENEKVVIEKSTITDIKICSLYLPYINKFISHDKHLIKIINFLFKNHSNLVIDILDKTT